MPNLWNVRNSPRFERNVRKLVRGNRELADLIRAAKSILSRDPMNTSQRYNIKKLTEFKPGDGQWRIAIGKYRLRDDLVGNEVIRHSIRHRRTEPALFPQAVAVHPVEHRAIP